MRIPNFNRALHQCAGFMAVLNFWPLQAQFGCCPGPQIVGCPGLVVLAQDTGNYVGRNRSSNVSG